MFGYRIDYSVIYKVKNRWEDDNNQQNASNRNKSKFLALNDECLIQILDYLQPKELVQIKQTCKKLNKVVVAKALKDESIASRRSASR